MEMTGKSFRTIKGKLAKVKPVREDGRAAHYDSKEALDAIYSHATDLAKETLLLERAKREKAEIEVGKLRGELVPVTEVEKVMAKEYNTVRNRIRAMASTFAKPLSMVSDPIEIFARITKHTEEALAELSADTAYAEAAKAQEPMVNVPTPPDEAGERVSVTTESG